MGHEIGHVVARHSAEQIAKTKLTEGLTGAVVIASYDPDDPSSMRTGQVAALIGSLVNMRFGREDELESDFLGVCFIQDAGYNPEELISVMKILAQSSQGTGAARVFQHASEPRPAHPAHMPKPFRTWMRVPIDHSATKFIA